MSTDDLLAIALLALLAPAFPAYLLWLLVLRPRRALRVQRERAEVLSRALGLDVLEPGRVGGSRDGTSVEVRTTDPHRMQRSPGLPTTHCLALIEPRFHHSFVVVSPAVAGAAGWSERWTDDVGIGAPSSEARALAVTVAPVVQSIARSRPPEVLRVELDAHAARLVLSGIVLDPAVLERTLGLALELARRARGAVPTAQPPTRR